MDTRVAAGRTLIRRYALALAPAGAGIEAAVTAASVPPLSGGPSSHGSEAAHAPTIADSVAEPAASPLRLRTPRSGASTTSLTRLLAPAKPSSLTISERGAKVAKRHQAVSGYWHTQTTLARWCRTRSYLDSAASHGSPSAGYRLATDAERVVRPCIMVVWVDVRLRRQGIARQLVDAAARHASVTPSGLAWAEPFTDSGYHLAHSVAPHGLWIADYN
jgi:GNAT superfamily N-acetyltransferase